MRVAASLITAVAAILAAEPSAFGQAGYPNPYYVNPATAQAYGQPAGQYPHANPAAFGYANTADYTGLAPGAYSYAEMPAGYGHPHAAAVWPKHAAMMGGPMMSPDMACGEMGCPDMGCPDVAGLMTEPDQHDPWWVRSEYLYWRAKGQPLPPLVTTSPIGTDQSEAGVLGEPGTSVLFGDEKVDSEFRSGGRISFGVWIGGGDYVGIQGSYMALATASTNFSQTSIFSDGSLTDPILAIPFFNVVTGLQDSVVVAFPDFISGGVPIDLDGTVTASTHSDVQSAELLYKNILWIDGHAGYRVYVLGGYKFFKLDEDLTLVSEINPVGGVFPAGSFIDSVDIFDTESEFHGGVVGLHADWCHGPWSLEVVGKVALGNTRDKVHIQGSTTSFDGTNTSVFAGGVFAQPTNIGHQTDDEFAVLSELNLNFGVQITRHIKGLAGYTIFYNNHVVRPGDQIDVGLNPTQFEGGALVGAARPAPTHRFTDYYLHGLNAGVEISW